MAQIRSCYEFTTSSAWPDNMHWAKTPLIYDTVAYCLKAHQKFIKDLSPHYPLQFYCGAFDWYGPAVEVDYLDDLAGLTSVRCQWDESGKRCIVYPVLSDRGLPHR